MAGAVNHASGLAAEHQVARHYQDAGLQVARRRWRGQGGEIDLICRDGDAVVFIEVKRARTHAQAITRLSPRQISRIHVSATEFLGSEPAGTRTEARFDVALVDGQGRIEILENAMM